MTNARARRSFGNWTPLAAVAAVWLPLSPAQAQLEAEHSSTLYDGYHGYDGYAEEASAPEEASASRPFFFGLGVGASVSLDDRPALFKLQEQLGYQFDPISIGSAGDDVVLRIGGDFAQHAGEYTILQFGARVTASFGVWSNDDVTIRVAPSIGVGAAYFSIPLQCFFRTCSGGVEYPAFNLQLATQGELELLGGLLTVFVRPLAIDGFLGDRAASRWDFLAGLDIHL
jgi:hypothetical protein